MAAASELSSFDFAPLALARLKVPPMSPRGLVEALRNWRSLYTLTGWPDALPKKDEQS